MSDFQYFARALTSFVFILYTALTTLGMFLRSYVKNPFGKIFVPKLRIKPPVVFQDLKYGIHKYVVLNGARIHYMESGDSSKPLMVFLHGFPEFWYSWRYQIVDFNKDYWCVAVDLRGFGDSEKSDNVSDYKIDVLAEDIRSLINHLGAPKCILLGHDLGGMVACKLRDNDPELVSAVVLLASGSIEAWFNDIWSNGDQLLKSWFIFLATIPKILENWLQLNDMAYFDNLLLSPGCEFVTKDDVECYKYWYGKPGFITAAVNFFRANLTCAAPNKEVKVGIPMFALHADFDQFLEVSIIKATKDRYPDLKAKLIDDVGHCLQQQNPEKVNKLIRRFLEECNFDNVIT